MSVQDWDGVFAVLREQSADGASVQVLERVLALGHDVATGTVGCSVTQFDGDRYWTPAASSGLALELDVAQYAELAGPCVSAAHDHQAQQIDELRDEPRFPGFVGAALRRGVRSSLSLPIAGREHSSALNLYATVESAYASPAARDVASLVARMVTAVAAPPAQLAGEPASTELLAARARGARVQTALERLMALTGMERAAALAVLTERSRAAQATLYVVAEALLDGDNPQR